MCHHYGGGNHLGNVSELTRTQQEREKDRGRRRFANSSFLFNKVLRSSVASGETKRFTREEELADEFAQCLIVK